jgi:uncharacterized membrane protein YGL010W
MKTIHQWFDEYGESHQNKTNKIIHWFCIPLIFWSIIALLASLPSDHMKFTGLTFLDGCLHWGTAFIALGLLFYLRLSFKIFLGMLVFSFYILIDVYFTVYFFDAHKFWGILGFLNGTGEDFLLYSAIVVFVIAWVLQFIGHRVEGKKPSFFKDIQFLLIGPAWLLGFLLNKMGIKY